MSHTEEYKLNEVVKVLSLGGNVIFDCDGKDFIFIPIMDRTTVAMWALPCTIQEWVSDPAKNFEALASILPVEEFLNASEVITYLNTKFFSHKLMLTSQPND